MKIISLVFVALSAAITPQQGGQQIVQYFTSETQQQASQGETWLRMAHAKPHGCVQAYVTVNENIPASLQQGIFATPGYEYQAFIRFSNGVGRGFTPLLQGNESDAVPDIRGFGLKIFNCAGSFPSTPSVDFQFTTSRVSFLPDVPSAVSFFNAVFQGNIATTLWLTENPRLAALFADQGIDGNIDDLLTATWWTPVVSRFGPTFFKSRLTPCGSSVSTVNEEMKKKKRFKSYDYYTVLLEQDLASNDYCFNWDIQLWQNNQTTPIDDTTIQWNTPFTSIAQITIPSQNFNTPGKWAYCDYMSFNPALNIAAHAPVGVLQDLRSIVYTAMPPVRRSALGLPPNQVATCTNWENWPNL